MNIITKKGDCRYMAEFGNNMQIGDGIALGAILVALFGQRFWSFYDKNRKKKETSAIIRYNLDQLKSDLLRIRDERNKDKKQKNDQIIFNSTSLSEVDDYYFLYSDLLLPNSDQFRLSKYPATIDFFIHYKINMETIRKREAERAGSGYLTLGTVNKLIERLEKAIEEY